MKALLRTLSALALVVGLCHAPAFAAYVGAKTTADTVHAEVYSWNGAGTVQTVPESLFVVVYGPTGDSIYSSIVDTSSATVKGPYLRRRGNGGTLNVYNWAQPVSAIDGDKGEGLYHASIWIGGAEDTSFVTDIYFDLTTIGTEQTYNEVGATLDTLQSQDGWVAQQSEVANIDGASMLTATDVWNLSFGTSFTAGSMGDSLNNSTYVQGSASGLDSSALSRIVGRKIWGIAAGSGSDSSTVSQRGADARYISGDNTAADNLETMLDGTGGQVLTLRRLTISNSTTNDTGVVIRGNGTAPGIWARGGATGVGILALGGTTSGDAIQGTSVSGEGLQLTGGTNGSGLAAIGAGSGHGLLAQGGATGNGFQGVGGSSSGRGLNATATANDYGAVFTGVAGAGLLAQGGTNSAGLRLLGNGTAEGLLALGGATGHGALFRGGATSGHGLVAQAQGAASHGIYAYASVTGGRGMKLDSGFQVIDNGITYEIDTLTADPDPLGHLITFRGVIGGAPGATGFVVTSLNGNNDHWNDMLFEVINGNAAGQARFASDFTGSTDSLTFDVAFSVTPASGDSIIGWAINEGAAGGGSSPWSTVEKDSVLRNMEDGYLTSAKIATDAIGAAQLAANSIGSSEIASGAITSAKFASGAIDAAAIATGAIGSAEFAAEADMWNLAFNTAWTAGSMGDSLNNASYVQGSASGLTAAEVADSIFARDSSDFNDGGATSFGGLMATPSYLQGAAAGITEASIYSYFISGSNEDQFKADVSALALQAEVANLNGWNPTTDNVVVPWSQLATQASVITATTLADNAITVNKIAASAISSGKFAAGAINATVAPNLDAAVSTRLAPTVSGRTLDVATTGEAGVDLNNVLGTLSGSEILLTQAEFSPDYAVAGDAMTLTPAERASIADSVNAQLAAYLVDSLNQVKEAARLVALHQGIVPSVYDSSWVVMYPGAWTPNKDSLKVFAFAGAVIDTVTMNRYRWGYYVVGSDSTAVADTVKCYPR